MSMSFLLLKMTYSVFSIFTCSLKSLHKDANLFSWFYMPLAVVDMSAMSSTNAKASISS